MFYCKRLREIALASTTLFMVACAQDSSHQSHPTYDAPNPTVTIEPGNRAFSPDEITYACADESICPDNQGLLFGVRDEISIEGNYRVTRRSITRCTGTLYGPTKVLTAGHCVVSLNKSDEIYFKTASSLGRPSRTSVVKKHSIDYQNFADLWRADFGSLELNSAINNVQYAAPAVTVGENYFAMTALVANAKDEGGNKDFVLNAVQCTNSAALELPLTYDRNPSVFLLHSCKLYSGNSGGAVVLKDNPTAVLGVVQTSNNADSSVANPMKSKGESKFDSAGVANARCFSLPGWPQILANCLEMNESTVAQLRKTAMLGKIKNHVEGYEANWKNSPYANVVVERAKIRMIPAPAEVTEEERYGKKMKIYDVFVPAPSCIEGNLKSRKVEIYVEAEAFEVQIDPLAIMNFKKTRTPILISATITKAAQNKYSVLYNLRLTDGDKLSVFGKVTYSSMQTEFMIEACTSERAGS